MPEGNRNPTNQPLYSAATLAARDPVVFRQVKQLILGTEAAEELQSTNNEKSLVHSLNVNNTERLDVKLETDGESLSPELDGLLKPETLSDRDRLEAIIEIVSRPSLLVKNGKWENAEIEEIDNRLMRGENNIKRAIPKVGRIETQAEHAPEPKMIGTGWMIDTDIMVTNSHVAEEFTKKGSKEDQFELSTDVGYCQADLKREHENASRQIVVIKDVLWIDKKLSNDEYECDVAFLKVAGTDFDLPEPLIPAKKELVYDPESLLDVVAIGYPAEDPYQNTFVMENYFKGIYEVKRISPGYIIGIEEPELTDNPMRLEHDCSTLGGSSGSAIIDVTTGEVVGLHCSGRYRQRNIALKISKVMEKLDQAIKH